jgi:creatinine amidohydrolase
MILYKMKWPEVKAEVEKGTPVLVPVGSTEQHGYHLPLDTDMAICYHVAEKAAQRSQTIITPPLNFGYNEKEWMFPGTISLQSETLLHCLVDICMSLARSGFRRLAIVNGHGYNRFIVPQAAHMVMEKADVLVVAITYWDLIADLVAKHRESKLGGISHSCEFETSAKLYLDPEHVDMSKAVEEIPPIMSKFTWSDLASASPVYIRARFDKLTKSGAMGNPLVASAEKGKIWVEAAIERLAEFMESFKKDFDHLLP